MEAQNFTVKLMKLFSIFQFIILINFLNASFSPINYDDNSRFRRSAQKSCAICNLHNISKNSSCIELAIVFDNSSSSINRNTSEIIQFCHNITDKVNALFHLVNIFVGLLEVVIWNDESSRKIAMDPNISKTYSNFENYSRSLFDKNIDHVQLISSYTFDKDFIPSNITTEMCNSSTGIIRNYSDNETAIAIHLAYVLAYNMGTDPNNESCVHKESWSWKNIGQPIFCLLTSLDETVSKKECLACFKNEPTKLFNRSVCGNGFLETGEVCDCALTNSCNFCCDPRTCKFTNNICNVAKCNFVQPKCNGTEDVCPFGKDDEVCDSQGQCQWTREMFPKCNSPTSPPNNTSNKTLDNSQWNIYFHILVAVILLIGAMLFLFFIYHYVRKLCSSHNENRLETECGTAHFNRPFNEARIQPRLRKSSLPPTPIPNFRSATLQSKYNDNEYSYPYSLASNQHIYNVPSY